MDKKFIYKEFQCNIRVNLRINAKTVRSSDTFYHEVIGTCNDFNFRIESIVEDKCLIFKVEDFESRLKKEIDFQLTTSLEDPRLLALEFI